MHAARFRNRSIYGNLLTGTIPDSIGSAAQLTYLCVLIDLAASSLMCVRVRAEGSRSGVSLLCRRFVFVRVCLFLSDVVCYLARSTRACIAYVAA